MYKSFFTDLAKKENGKFLYKDESLAYINGVRSPNVNYRVDFDYLGCHFTVINRTGTAYVGMIKCEISPNLNPIEFEINNITHFENLFRRKKSRLRIKSDNLDISNFLKNNEEFIELERIAARDKFSPVIVCENKGNWKIMSKYHLEFDNWIEPVEPTIALFKSLINKFDMGSRE